MHVVGWQSLKRENCFSIHFSKVPLPRIADDLPVLNFQHLRRCQGWPTETRDLVIPTFDCELVVKSPAAGLQDCGLQS